MRCGGDWLMSAVTEKIPSQSCENDVCGDNIRGDYESSCYLSAVMDIGELLLAHGAEVSRVEDTISRLCRAWGFVRSDVFTITSSIVASAMLPDGRTITQTRRIKERDTDFRRVELVNALSRRICESTLDLEEVRTEIRDIQNMTFKMF